ncbi:methyltransferase domain-containing protein [Paenibacillus agilis]|nr:methyltransferase domain-containing protein [Paenibacillus agilis]
MMSKNAVNTKEYWDDRFDTDWEENKGREQTGYFVNLAIKEFPEWLSKDIKDNKLSFCDAGCAEGDGVHVLSQFFAENELVGMDFSESAIHKAKLAYPNLNFICGNIQELSKKYDVLFSSNTFEHFLNPMESIRKLTEVTAKYIILLLPFQEYDRISEHFYTFDYNTFPVAMNNFNLVHFNEIDCRRDPKTPWYGKQVFVVYANSNTVDIENIKFDYNVLYLKGIEQQRTELLDLNGSLRQELHSSQIHVMQKESELVACRNEVNQLDSQIKTLSQKSVQVHEELEKCRGEILEIQADLLKEKKLVEQQKQEVDKQKYEVAKLIDERYAVTLELNKIHDSNLWKVARKYYKLRDGSNIGKFFKSIKNNGVKVTTKKVYSKLKKKYINIRYKSENEYNLQKILSHHKDKPIIIYPPLLDWDIPLFQRPQHIALNLSDCGYLYFYCTINHYDDVRGFKEYEGYPNLYITDQYELLMKNIKSRIVHVYAQDGQITSEFIHEQLQLGNKVLYEYLDALHEDLCTSKNNVIGRHLDVLKDERCIVVATADKLYQEVSQYRSNNFKLVTNGVEMNHFQSVDKSVVPDDIKKIVNKKKPIIGYFGALAKWFDYRLVEKLASERPDYEILLIGWNYDGSLEQHDLGKYENISIVGPINYKELPKYAVHFDVSTIPFLINEITEATSPIKLFEYMALGHPIVTSDLPECRKYKSVLVAKDHDSFIDSIDKALSMRNDVEYNQIINSEALDNTWKSKAKHIAQLIDNNDSL